MTRIEALKTYLVDVLTSLNKSYGKMNVNFLSNNIDDYNLQKIPNKTIVNEDISGNFIDCKDQYNFMGRYTYGSNIAENLENMGFWEEFESKIYSNNEKGTLPNIDGIIEIKCLNCGSIQDAEPQSCVMSIQIEIDYEVDSTSTIASL